MSIESDYQTRALAVLLKTQLGLKRVYWHEDGRVRVFFDEDEFMDFCIHKDAAVMNLSTGRIECSLKMLQQEEST